MDQLEFPKKLTLVVFISIAIALSLNIASFFLVGNLTDRSTHVEALGLWICYAVILAGTSLSMISLLSYVLNPSPWVLAKSATCTLIALIAHLLIARKLHLVNPVIYFALFGVLTSLYGTTMLGGVFEHLKTNLNTKLTIVGIHSGVLFLITLVGFFSYQWRLLSEQAMTLGVLRDLVICSGMVVPLVLVSFVKGYQVDPASRLNSLLLRLPLSKQERHHRNTMIGAAGLSFASIALRLLVWGLKVEPDTLRFFDAFFEVHLGFLAFGYSSYYDLKNSSIILNKHLFASKLLNHSAKRFLSRHDKEGSHWAATVGFKSSTYMIDHDPQEILMMNIPSSVRQLRAEEIHRCLSQMLGNMNLHLLEIGHTIHGAIDAEASIRPCVDLLRLFSCLYLDAGPLVERRINGLSSLIPIVDPKLARLLEPRELNALLKRNYWFFYIDFGWIDQRITKAVHLARYDVNLANYATGQLISSLRKSDKLQLYGNSIWVSPEARSRILQEAPSLANIIEPNPVQFDQNAADELFFVIKFEQLIPRLQRYFDLDSLRQIILDFDPSPESSQFLNLFNLQIPRAGTTEEIFTILKTIQSVPWRGFKEKDGAIKLIIQAQEQIRKILKVTGLLAEDQRPEALRAQELVHEAILKIGYPSQTLHMAQVAKNILRDLTKLIEVAQTPYHPRFAEAWLLLASFDFQRTDKDRVYELLKFLGSLGTHPEIFQLRLPQAKSVEALCSLARCQIETTKKAAFNASLEIVFESFLKWFVEAAVAPETMCLLLDAHQYLHSQLGIYFEIKPEHGTQLDRYVADLKTKMTSQDPKLIALLSRWETYKLPQVA